MFDSKISLRTMANTAAVRFASAAERCYRLERAGKATFDDFNAGRNTENENEEQLDGKIEMSLHTRTTVLGAIWATLNTQCLSAGDNKYDAPMSLEDAYSLVVFGAVVPRAERSSTAGIHLAKQVSLAVAEARETAQLLLEEGEIDVEEAKRAEAIAEQETRQLFHTRFADFQAVLDYIEAVPVDFGYQDNEHLAELLNRLEVEEKQNWYARALDKLIEAKSKLIDKLFSTKIPAKAKSDMRAELPLLKADIQYLEQLCH